MLRNLALYAALAFPLSASGSSHGPVFGLATPTNSQGEWSFDLGTFGRSSSIGSEASVRALIAYGFTPHLTVSVTVPTVLGNTPLPPTRIQPGDDFDTTVASRFQHKTTHIGTRLESTAFAGLAVPGAQSQFKGISHVSHSPGTMVGAVTGLASRSHYLWIGSTFTEAYEHDGNRRPNVWDYSLVYGYRPARWRKEADKWDWRFFGELVGEKSGRFIQGDLVVPGTDANQVFVGPSMLGIKNNYTVSFGAQVPVFRQVGFLFPKERVRYAVNFSYLLFQHSHSH